MSNIVVNGSTYELPDEVTAQKTALYNAALIALAAMSETAWASWTPTWTNLTVGNSVVTAKYKQIGKVVFCRLTLVLGSSGSVSSNAAGVNFSLPVTRAANAGTATLLPQGQARFFDLSATTGYEGQALNNSTTTALLAALDAGSAYLKSAVVKDTVPFTWATGDEIHVQFSYEAA